MDSGKDGLMGKVQVNEIDDGCIDEWKELTVDGWMDGVEVGWMEGAHG